MACRSASATRSRAEERGVTSARQGRARQSTLTLIGALGASFAIVFLVFFITVRPANLDRGDVDWNAVWSTTESSLNLVNPRFTADDGDWWSNRAEFIGGDVPVWYIGFVTPTQGFVSIEQFRGEPPVDIADDLADVNPTTATIAGRTWAVFDRTGVDNPGNREMIYLLSDQTDLGTLVVSGSASAAEIDLVATRALESVEASR